MVLFQARVLPEMLGDNKPILPIGFHEPHHAIKVVSGGPDLCRIGAGDRLLESFNRKLNIAGRIQQYLLVWPGYEIEANPLKRAGRHLRIALYPPHFSLQTARELVGHTETETSVQLKLLAMAHQMDITRIYV